MFLFRWLNVDWVALMPFEVAILFLVVIIIRILRILKRWPRVNVSHVQTSQMVLENCKFYCSKYKLPEGSENSKKLERSENNAQLISELQPRMKILLFPPLGQGNKSTYHIAAALALLKFDVYLLSSKNLKKYIKYSLNSSRDPVQSLSIIIEKISPDFIIGFDYIMPILLEFGIKFKKIFINQKLSKLIIVRPIPSLTLIKSWYHLNPFRSEWLSTIRIKRYYKSVFPSLIHKKFKQVPDEILSNLYVICAQRNPLTLEGNIQIDNWKGKMLSEEEKHLYRIKKGGWSFFMNETVAYGVLLKLLLLSN
ncbi:MAG: hypothetical protein ACTSVU_01320 [Promethearchaeota archaeon]